MPTETLIFLGLVFVAFGAFGATFIGVDLYTADVRTRPGQHPAE
ncbi:MAG TPA: hypothetical protein VIQ29_06615 [Ancylobacter sp.]